MLSKLLLYGHTVLKMKPGQIFARVKKTLGLKISLGTVPGGWNGEIVHFRTPVELDFDPVFIARFNADEFADGVVTFLHETETIDWNGKWEAPNRSPLWNFNLHYFEYLMSYVDAYKRTEDLKYIKAIENCIGGWIDNNPVSAGGNGWAAYTIALRVVYWFSCLFELDDLLSEQFKEKMISSLYCQYVYLANHLEKDILANHYFEDLKALILCSIAFHDDRMLEQALHELKSQCKEQILPDGMHCELSPMYHKIILEALLRTAVALQSVKKADPEIDRYIQPMSDVAYSLEEGLDRIPLFNDGGNNVAKSLEAILCTEKSYFNIVPQYKAQLPDSGYYIFKWNDWKMIVDAGAPGLRYNAGHAHCDAMSFELFHKGAPVIVNCGTYAYQCKERSFFRSTAAHNTVMADGIEQSECWGTFRTGKAAKTRVISVTDNTISMDMTDQKSHRITRQIIVSPDGITVKDSSDGNKLTSYVHTKKELQSIHDYYREPYAADYGIKETVATFEFTGEGKVEYSINKDAIEGTKYHSETHSIYRGYKPLAYLNRRLYFYSDGIIWTERNGSLQNSIEIGGNSWKDNNRTLKRLFRREPKYAVPIDSHRMLVAWKRKLILVDVDNKDVLVLCISRDGFSDPLNLCAAKEKWIAVWGDYGSNPGHEAINIYGLNKNLSVETIYTFPKGSIRHIHNIIPRLEDGYYIFTGDQEEKAGIYTADSLFEEVRPLKTGKQQYRAVVGFDTPNGLLYATDAVNEQNYVYLLNEEELRKICSLNGSCIYGTEHGTDYYFATTVEPDENNRGLLSWVSKKRGTGILSDEVMLVKASPNLTTEIVLSYTKDVWPAKLMQYGSVQFPHGVNQEFWIYPVAVKKYDGCAVKL